MQLLSESLLLSHIDSRANDAFQTSIFDDGYADATNVPKHAVGPDDTVYVSDAQGGMSLPGQVFAVKAGKATKLSPELMPGSPAGIAVTVDGSRLLVSSLGPTAGTSQVEVILTSNAF